MFIVVFEDELVAQLDPVTLSRPAFAISCGSRRLIDLLMELGPPVRASMSPSSARAGGGRLSARVRRRRDGRGPVLLVWSAEAGAVAGSGRAIAGHARRRPAGHGWRRRIGAGSAALWAPPALPWPALCRRRAAGQISSRRRAAADGGPTGSIRISRRAM